MRILLTLMVSHQMAFYSVRPKASLFDMIGGSIERWEDPGFRACFAEIFSGDWRSHDPYDLERRIDAKSSLYNRKNQVSCPNHPILL